MSSSLIKWQNGDSLHNNVLFKQVMSVMVLWSVFHVDQLIITDKAKSDNEMERLFNTAAICLRVELSSFEYTYFAQPCPELLFSICFHFLFCKCICAKHDTGVLLSKENSKTQLLIVFLLFLAQNGRKTIFYVRITPSHMKIVWVMITGSTIPLVRWLNRS